VANVTRSCDRPYCTGDESTRVARSCEERGKRCPPFHWNQLGAAATACQPPQQEVLGMWPPPAQIHGRPTRPHWRLRAPGRL